MLNAMKLKHQTQPLKSLRRAQRFVALSACIAATTADAGDLTIEITGISPDRGKVYVAVYDAPESFPLTGHQRVGQVVASEDSHLTLHFKDLPPGHYAAVAFQDLNGNGKLDKNFLGLPKEPYGFSNHARGTAGPPSFSEAAVTLDPDGATAIVLK
jgi:uncharacterized protein (DUF2141 family)